MDPQAGLSLRGAMTFASTPALYSETQRTFAGDSAPSRVDLEGVTRADSAGLALLLEWQSTQRRQGRSLEVRNAPESLLRLARLCEADDQLDITGRPNT